MHANRQIEEENVYLCQVSPYVSCGACCGLYNVADPSPASLEARLLRRSRWFAGVVRTVDGIDAFRERVKAAETGEPPFPFFHHCPFLGMIEDTGKRVGCLLHPLAEGNNGVDFRGMSHYGGMACRTYFCPSVRQLPSRWLTAIRASMDSWYLHGLVVTEKRLLTAFFSELERRLGRLVHGNDFSADAGAAALVKTFAALKCHWPFRRETAPGVCNYFFEDGLYQRPRTVNAHRGPMPAYLEQILIELDTGGLSANDRQTAAAMIASLIEQLVARLEC